MEWYKNPEWCSAIGTIFVGIVAVLIAIFQEKIVRHFRMTELQSDLKLAPPDCHKIKIRDALGIESDCYYCRIKVINIGKYPAENVEVMINKCWEIGEDEKWHERKSFLPMNLKWSHYGTIEMSRILPMHFRHCDIGSFRFTFGNKVILVLDTATQPNQVEGGKYPNVLEAGRYKIE